MRIRNAGLAALVAAAGIWMSFSGDPVMAAKSTAKSTAKSATKSAKAAKATSANRPVALSKFKKQRVTAKKSRSARYAKKSGSKVASKTIEAPETWDDKPARSETKAAAPQSKTELPASVANARAQALADDEARNYAALDSTDVVNGMKLASADQANGSNTIPDNNAAVAQEATPPAASPPPTSAPGKILRPMPSGDRPVAKIADDSDPWSKTSLIGKIFIAFGSLLTLASAARLLIA